MAVMKIGSNSDYREEILEIVDEIEFEKIIDHPNILIAAGFWERDRYLAAKVCYKFMRMINDLIDNRKASDKKITPAEKKMLSEKVNTWINYLSCAPSNDPFVKELIETITRFKIPMELFRNFARSMHFDIDHNGFASFDEFLAYSEGASVAPASVFVHLCCLSKADDGFHLPPFDVIEVARPCAIFSYIVHIIRDFQKDQWNNLNYFANDILNRYNLKPADLREIADGSNIPYSFREVIGEYYSCAQYWAVKTFQVLETISSRINGRYMLSLQIIFSLYQQVFERIDIKNGLFTKEELNPTPEEIKQKVLEIIKMHS